MMGISYKLDWKKRTNEKVFINLIEEKNSNDYKKAAPHY